MGCSGECCFFPPPQPCVEDRLTLAPQNPFPGHLGVARVRTRGSAHCAFTRTLFVSAASWGERGGERADLSVCSQRPGCVYKLGARLRRREEARLTRGLAAVLCSAPPRHGHRGALGEGSRRVRALPPPPPPPATRGPRPPHAARGRGLRRQRLPHPGPAARVSPAPPHRSPPPARRGSALGCGRSSRVWARVSSARLVPPAPQIRRLLETVGRRPRSRGGGGAAARGGGGE